MVGNRSQTGAEKPGGTPHSKASLRLWLRLLSCSLIVEKSVRLKLQREYATTLPRFDVMAALYRRPGSMTMGELSRQVLMSNGNVTGLVTRLIADGLLRAEQHDDRRVQRVALTPRGRTRFKRVAAAHERWIDAAFGGLSDREIAELLARLANVRHSIDRHPI